VEAVLITAAPSHPNCFFPFTGYNGYVRSNFRGRPPCLPVAIIYLAGAPARRVNKSIGRIKSTIENRFGGVESGEGPKRAIMILAYQFCPREAVLFTIAAFYVLVWLLHAARTVFVLIRGEIREQEKRYYTKICVVHTFVYALLGTVAWIVPFSLVFFDWSLDSFLPYRKTYLAIFYYIVPATALTGVFLQKWIYARIYCGIALILYIWFYIEFFC
jgi:hypothetical protein